MSTPISFRFDFRETEPDAHYCSVIVQNLGEYFPGVVGVETMNKYGETIKKHLHYNFLYPGDESAAEKFVAKIRKRIQRNNSESSAPRQKGYYSLTVPKVEDYDRWFRYGLKQVETFDKVLRNDRIHPPPDFDYEIQWKLANEEYLRDVEHLSKRRETADKRQTTLQKIMDLASNEVFPDKDSVFDFVFKYYKDEMIPMERLKMRGIIDTVCIHYHLITYAEWKRNVMN